MFIFNSNTFTRDSPIVSSKVSKICPQSLGFLPTFGICFSGDCIDEFNDSSMANRNIEEAITKDISQSPTHALKTQNQCTTDVKPTKMQTVAKAAIPLAAAAAKTGFGLLLSQQASADIGLENHTDSTFTHLKTVTRHGTIKQQLKPKLERGIYSMRAQGPLLPLTGTDGIVALRLDGSDIAFVIVWCVPSMQCLPRSGCNRLAIGVYNSRHYPDVKKILKSVKTNQGRPYVFLRYIKEDSKDSITTIELDYIIKIMANMNNDQSGRVMIQILPTTTLWKVQSPNDPSRPSENEWIQHGKNLEYKTVDDLMSETKLRVVGVIEITNWTDHKLTDARIRTDGGRMSEHLQELEPLTKEAVVVHKYPGTATGSYGTLSLYIEKLDCRIVLMWSLPFNHDFYSNWLALDITAGPHIDHSTLFDEMYYGENVVRKEYYREFGNTVITKHGLTMTATMTSSHRAHIKLKVEMKQR